MPKRLFARPTRRIELLLLFGVLAFAGCGDDLPFDPSLYPCLSPADHLGNPEALPERHHWTPDDEFSYWARRIPGGFGGFFYGTMDGIGEPDKINFFLVDLEQQEEAADTLIYILQDGDRTFRNLQVSRFALNALQGEFDWLQLQSCYHALRDGGIWDVEGVLSSDIDDSKNRLAYGVENMRTAQLVWSKVDILKVPREMVTTHLAAPVGWR